jgi:cytochrome P450
VENGQQLTNEPDLGRLAAVTPAYSQLTAQDLDVVVAADDYQRFCDGRLGDPYPLLGWLRDHDPVHYSEMLGAWVVTRYEHVRAGLLDKRLANDRIAANFAPLPDEIRTQAEPLAAHISNWLGFTDPPKHTRLRALLRETFTPKLSEAMAQTIRTIGESLAGDVAGAPESDLVSGYALALPALVICDILGVAPEDSRRFSAWSEDMVAVTGHVGPSLARIVPEALDSYRALDGFVAGEIAARAGCPAHDLLGVLAEAETAGRLDRPELIGLSVFSLVAGHETTASLLGSMLHTVLADPSLAARLRAEPALWSALTEEMLRLESPIQLSPRVAAEDLEVGERTIRAGDTVILHLGAANRDPRQFPAGGTLDLDAATTRHLAFAWGPHFCLGAPLARAEATIALPLLLERVPDLELAVDGISWRENMSIRGLTTLPVRRQSMGALA